MNWQEFEQNLSDQVQGHETPLDTDALWERLQPQRKRRRWFLLPLVGCLGLLVTGALAVGAFWWGRSGTNKVVPTETVALSPAPVATGSGKPLTPAADSGTLGPRGSSANAATASSVQSSRSQFFNQSIQNQSFNHKKSHTGSTSKATNSLPYPTALSTANTPNTATAATSTNALTTPTFTFDSASVVAVTPPVGAEQTAQPYRPGCPRVATLLAQVECQNCQTKDTVQRQTATDNLPAPKIPTWRIGLEAGLYAWQPLFGHTDTALGTPLPRDGEHQLEAFSLGLAVQKQVSSRLALRSGVQYTRFNSVYRWKKIKLDTLPRLTPNFYVNGSSDTTVNGSAVYLLERQVRHYNQVNQWTLPIECQYFIQKGRLRLAPFVGLNLRFRQQASGLISGANGLPEAGVFAKTYQRSVSLGAQMGVVWEMPLGKRSYLTVAPTLAGDLTPRSWRGAPQVERFVQAGVRIGWQRTF